MSRCSRWSLTSCSEALCEDESFPERKLASLVLAKVYYHLQLYNESMVYALGAGDLFKLDNEGEFEETIISKCVDTYISVSAQRHATAQDNRERSRPVLSTSFSAMSHEANSAAAALTSPTTPFSQSTLPSKSLLSRVSTENMLETPQLEVRSASAVPDRRTQAALQRVIERLFEDCMQQSRYKQVVGIAIEARNLDVLTRVIKRAAEEETKSSEKQAEGASPTEELMEYVLDICMNVVQERGLRTQILRLILDLLNDIPSPDYFSIAKCVVYLDEDESAFLMLKKLVVCPSGNH